MIDSNKYCTQFYDKLKAKKKKKKRKKKKEKSIRN